MNPSNLDSILLITSNNPQNHRFGTGFVIYHFENASWVVTCAHVVNDVGGENALEINGSTAKIAGIGKSDDLDLSLLETKERLNIPVIKLGTYGRHGSPFTTAGYQLFGKHFSIRRIVGRLTQQHELVSKSVLGRIKVWAVTIFGDDTLQDGYSGAPIIDDESGCCIGVISYKQGDGKNGLAISIDELERILPPPFLNLIEKPASSRRINNHADYLFEKATRLQIMGELQDALELFLQVKTANPTYPHIDLMTNLVENELGRKYVRHGRIDEDLVLHAPQAPHEPVVPKAESRPSVASRGVRFPLLLIGCVLFALLIVLAVVGYFLLRLWFGG